MVDVKTSVRCSTIRLSVSVCLLALAWTGQAKAAADETGNSGACTEAEDCGRRAFAAGVESYKAEDWATAAERFREALEYRWHASIALNLGLSLVKAGQVIEGIAVFDTVLAREDTSEEIASKAGIERQRAKEQLAFLVFDARPPAGASIIVDDVRAELDETAMLAVNPGAHRVVVSFEGEPPVSRDVTLVAGERVRLRINPARQLVLNMPERQTLSPPPEKDSLSSEAAVSSQSGLAPLWFFVSAGTTAALGGVALWSALDTRAAFDDYESDLPSLSQAEVNERVDDGHAKELRTNVLLGATAVCAAGTAVLGVFFTNWKGDRAIEASPSLGGFTVRGTF